MTSPRDHLHRARSARTVAEVLVRVACCRLAGIVLTPVPGQRPPWRRGQIDVTLVLGPACSVLSCPLRQLSRVTFSLAHPLWPSAAQPSGSPPLHLSHHKHPKRPMSRQSPSRQIARG